MHAITSYTQQTALGRRLHALRSSTRALARTLAYAQTPLLVRRYSHASNHGLRNVLCLHVQGVLYACQRLREPLYRNCVANRVYSVHVQFTMFNSACRAPGPTVNNYYNSSPGFGGFSPFGFSPFGFSPFGFGGGAVVVGAPVGGGFLLNFFLITLALGVVGRVVSSFSGGNKKNERDDQW